MSRRLCMMVIRIKSCQLLDCLLCKIQLSISHTINTTIYDKNIFISYKSLKTAVMVIEVNPLAEWTQMSDVIIQTQIVVLLNNVHPCVIPRCGYALELS